MSDTNNNNMDGSITIIITDDKLKALLTIRDETLFNKEYIEKLIDAKNIEFGLDQQLIDDLIKEPKRGTFIIAQGIPPRQGRDGYIDYFFTSQAPAAKKEDDQDNIDFREVFNIPSVDTNTLLAVYHPMDPGENGQAVTGQVLAPPRTVELAVKAGKGAVIGKDGLSIFSEEKGRPVVKKIGRNIIISVDSVYKHQGDVDIKSGNLRFNGDVFISGNVTENMIVDVTGNLKVAGFISRANVKVGGHLEVAKVITSSKIQVGGQGAAFSDIGAKIQDIYQSIMQLDAMTNQLLPRARQANPQIKYGQLVLALMDKKFTKLNKQIKELSNDVKKIKEQKPPQEIMEVEQALNCVSGIRALHLDSLENVKSCLKKALSVVDITQREPSNLLAYGIWNSDVAATGRIIVTGQGAFNSNLHALGNVEVKGVLRGGQVYARQNIKVGEIGGAMGIKTMARTEQGGTIKASQVFNGSVLQIASRIFTANRDENMVLARIDHEGNLVLR